MYRFPDAQIHKHLLKTGTLPYSCKYNQSSKSFQVASRRHLHTILFGTAIIHITLYYKSHIHTSHIVALTIPNCLIWILQQQSLSGGGYSCKSPHDKIASASKLNQWMVVNYMPCCLSVLMSQPPAPSLQGVSCPCPHGLAHAPRPQSPCPST